MNLMDPDGPWLSLLILAVLLVVIFRQPILNFLRLLVRAALGMGALALWSKLGLLPGLALGVNPFNALVLGALGLPGFGLLLLWKLIL